MLILQPVTADLYVVIAAVLRLGLIGIFLDPAANLAANLQQFPPRALIASRKVALWRWRYPPLRSLPLGAIADRWLTDSPTF
ncbi:MAG: hypothetical protein HC838_13815 [Spirulinaceae cyanobacterium RM2_2_10]|nr:hypothetical protein [Spirulinaceae cyanobacterium RM2_2_10]